MRVAPSASAYSTKTLNLISRLHSTSGFGVRPARYSARKCSNTLSQYSAAKLAVYAGGCRAAIAHRLGVGEIGPGGAVLGAVVLVPVLHEQALDRVALLAQQQRGNRRIDAARDADDDALAPAHEAWG
jgi:hypothetical protein